MCIRDRLYRQQKFCAVLPLPAQSETVGTHILCILGVQIPKVLKQCDALYLIYSFKALLLGSEKIVLIRPNHDLKYYSVTSVVKDTKQFNKTLC